MTRPSPYAADTRAKGWRFELDHERICQSDTWALSPPEYRPWLLMLWMTAWQQVPCGSLPSDDSLIAARIGMSAKEFAKAGKHLMRGWWLADDGRLYHDTIVKLVADMLKRKDAERQRKAEYRARIDSERAKSSASVPRDNSGTDTGRTVDSGGRDDTGTGTGTGLEDYGTDVPPSSGGSAPVPRDGHGTVTPTPAASVCIALKRAGIGMVNPSNPRLLALLQAGATPDEFTAAATKALDKADPFAYVLGTVEGERTRATRLAGQVHRGPLPKATGKQAAIESHNARVVAEILGESNEAS